MKEITFIPPQEISKIKNPAQIKTMVAADRKFYQDEVDAERLKWGIFMLTTPEEYKKIVKERFEAGGKFDVQKQRIAYLSASTFLRDHGRGKEIKLSGKQFEKIFDDL